ncbi:uncharacterized protein METZ01_LOCUS327351, partial [marine metagenome]
MSKLDFISELGIKDINSGGFSHDNKLFVGETLATSDENIA